MRVQQTVAVHLPTFCCALPWCRRTSSCSPLCAFICVDLSSCKVMRFTRQLVLLLLLVISVCSTAAHKAAHRNAQRLRRPKSLAEVVRRELKQQAYFSPHYSPSPLPPGATEPIQALKTCDTQVTVLPSPDSGYTVLVIDQNTLRVKGCLQDYLNNVCPFGVTSGVAVSPRKMHLTVTCPVSRHDYQLVEVSTKGFAITRTIDRPQDIHPTESLLYSRSGSLLDPGFNSSRLQPLSNVVLDYERPQATPQQYNLTAGAAGIITGMDLDTNGSLVLYTNQGPDVLTYNLNRERSEPPWSPSQAPIALTSLPCMTAVLSWAVQILTKPPHDTAPTWSRSRMVKGSSAKGGVCPMLRTSARNHVARRPFRLPALQWMLIGSTSTSALLDQTCRMTSQPCR